MLLYDTVLSTHSSLQSLPLPSLPYCFHAFTVPHSCNFSRRIVLIIFLTGLGNVVGIWVAAVFFQHYWSRGPPGHIGGFPGFGKNGPFGGGSAPRNNCSVYSKGKELLLPYVREGGAFFCYSCLCDQQKCIFYLSKWNPAKKILLSCCYSFGGISLLIQGLAVSKSLERGMCFLKRSRESHFFSKE